MTLDANGSEKAKIWVAGIGGIGGVVAYRLTRAGFAPLLVDAWLEHVAAMNESGLALKDQFADEPVPVRTVHLSALDTLEPAPDIVFLCVKSFQTTEFMRAIAPHLDENSTVVSLQNGINEETLAGELGPDRVIGAVVMMDGGLMEPGVAKQENPEERNFVLGTLDGRGSQRLGAAAEVLGVVGNVRTSGNIWGELWSKLVHNCLINAVCALTNRNAAWALREDTVWQTARTLALEAVQVAHGHDIALEPSALFGCGPEDFSDDAPNSRLRKSILAAYPDTEDLYPSMQQDVRKGRPTEIEFLNGWIVRKGKDVGVRTPLSTAITGLVHRVEDGSLKPHPGNVESFLQMLAAAAGRTEGGKT